MYSKAYGEAPRMKGVAIQDNAEVRVYRDAQPLSTDSITSNTLSFFPSSASNNRADANYIRNPLPRDNGYDILGLGLGFSYDSYLITPGDQTDVDLAGLINDALHSRILFETGQRSKLVDAHLHELAGLPELDFEIVGSDAGATGDGFTRVVKFPDSLTRRLQDPLHLEAQESWTFDVDFDSVTNIPSDTNYGNVGKGSIKMIAALYVAFQRTVQRPGTGRAQGRAVGPGQGQGRRVGPPTS